MNVQTCTEPAMDNDFLYKKLELEESIETGAVVVAAADVTVIGDGAIDGIVDNDVIDGIVVVVVVSTDVADVVAAVIGDDIIVFVVVCCTTNVLFAQSLVFLLKIFDSQSGRIDGKFPIDFSTIPIASDVTVSVDAVVSISAVVVIFDNGDDISGKADADDIDDNIDNEVRDFEFISSCIVLLSQFFLLLLFIFLFSSSFLNTFISFS